MTSAVDVGPSRRDSRSRAQPALAGAQHQQARHHAWTSGSEARPRDLPRVCWPLPTSCCESGPRGAAGPDLESPGVGGAETSAKYPRLVHCVITPFGTSGPWAGLRGRDLVTVALGGNAGLTGDADRPPVRCSMPTAYLHAGPEAALGIAMALYARQDSGRGQLVDVSLHEAQLATLLTGPGQYALDRRAHDPQRPAAWGAPGRSGGRADGDVSFGLRGGPARIPNLVATVEYMAEAGMAPGLAA